MNKLDIQIKDQFARDNMMSLLPKLNEIVQDVAKADGRASVIAGGSIRDTVFGLYPNDIDIFIDTSKMAPDEVDDEVLLFGHAIMEKVSKEFGEAAISKHRDGRLYGHGGNELKDGWTVYDTEYITFWHREVVEEFDDIQEFFDDARGTSLQFIGRPSPEIADPELFVKDFDYGLVRGWVDPHSGEICYDKSFVKEVESREIESNSRKTTDRIMSFTNRVALSTMPFKIKKTYIDKPQKSVFGDSVTQSYNVQFQNAMWVPVGRN